MKIRNGYTFDDVLLVPKHSDISSRKNIDLSTSLGGLTSLNLRMPIVSANMRNVTETDMARSISSLGGLAILHRFRSADETVEMYRQAAATTHTESKLVACSIGVQEQDKTLAQRLFDAGCRTICVDVAHGDHTNCVKMVEWLDKTFNHMIARLNIIAGNVATKSGALRLSRAGANIIKVGIGGGSLCTTRIETGNGVPQLSALAEVYEASWAVNPVPAWPHQFRPHREFKIIADGGIRRAGDIVKALCFSDAVMLGNVLAGTDEAPGNTVKALDGQLYKEYAGSSTHKSTHVEGVSALVPIKGSVKNVIERLLEGVASGLSYQGANNLDELRTDPEFVVISGVGLKESHPHDVFIR